MTKRLSRRKMGICVTLLAVLLVNGLLLDPSADAQTTTATISGSIKDPSGAVLPGVAITIKNLDTGITRNLVSDEMGRYRAAGLALDIHQVEASLPGFKTEVVGGIKLAVGQEAVIDLVLDVGEITERVLVTGEPPLVDTTSSAISGLVDDKKIRDLPLNLRSFERLALLQPGVVAFSQERTGLVGGRRQKISIMGTRPEHSSFLLDGTDINDVYNKTPGSVSGSLTGVETVKEFRVMINNYSAEMGRAAGGIINAVTRSGTNEFHGSIFEFLRNDALDARNFFDVGPPPEFKRNQFGAALGGPIVKDRTFFFASYEGLRETLGLSSVAFVPTRAARDGQLFPVNPAIRPFLELFPLPNFPNLGEERTGVGQLRTNPAQPTRDDFAMARIDHTLSAADSLFVRYTVDDGSVKRPERIPVTFEDEKTRNQYVTIQIQRIFSPTVLNTFRFAFNRNNSGAVNASTTDLSLMRFVPERKDFGRFEFTGDLTGFGAVERNPRLDLQNLFQYTDDISITRGGHSIKTGGDFRRFQINFNTITRVGGIYVFDNLVRFLAGQASRFRAPTRESKSDTYARQSLFAFYVQDDIKVHPRLTLNLGLRYEFITVPTEKYGRISSLRFPTDADVTVGPMFRNPSLRNFAPRFGFAWDVLGNAKTSLRGGFGIFHEQVTSNTWYLPFQQSVPFFATGDLRNPRNFPRDFAALQGDPRPRLQQINFDISNPYVMQYNLTIQRELGQDTVFSVGYGGSRGVKLFTRRNAITAVPTGRLPDGRPSFASGSPVLRHSRFNEVVSRTSDSNSFYNSLQASMNRRFSGGLQFQASYTFSKSIDDQSGIGTSDAANVLSTLQNPDDRNLDRGLSIFDVHHNLVFNYSYELPFGSGRRFGTNASGVAGRIISGWQINGITTMSSGNPFTVVNGFDSANNGDGGREGPHRPSLSPGSSNNPTRRGDPNRYFDTSAFFLETRTFGSLGRNTLIGPDLVNFDFSVVKNFRLAEARNLEFRTEFFNLFNHPNFRAPSVTGSGGAVVFTAVGRIDPRAGQLTSTVTTSRQVQFGLKVIF